MNTTVYNFKTRILDNILRSVKPTPIRNAFPEKALLPKTQTRPLLQHHSMTLRSGGAFLAFRDLNKVGWDSRSMSVTDPSHRHDFANSRGATFLGSSLLPHPEPAYMIFVSPHPQVVTLSLTPGFHAHILKPLATSIHYTSLSWGLVESQGDSRHLLFPPFSLPLPSLLPFLYLFLLLSKGWKKEREKRNLHFKQDHTNSFSQDPGSMELSSLRFYQGLPPTKEFLSL